MFEFGGTGVNMHTYLMYKWEVESAEGWHESLCGPDGAMWMVFCQSFFFVVAFGSAGFNGDISQWDVSKVTTLYYSKCGMSVEGETPSVKFL